MIKLKDNKFYYYKNTTESQLYKLNNYKKQFKKLQTNNLFGKMKGHFNIFI